MKSRSLQHIAHADGFTLVEVMVSLVVLLFVFMGLMQTALLSIEHNARNLIRDEAVAVAAMRMDEARNIPFDTLASDAGVGITLAVCAKAPVNDPTYEVRVDRNLRNMTVSYGTRRTVTSPPGSDPDTRNITVLVRWEYKDECYTHQVQALRRR